MVATLILVSNLSKIPRGDSNSGSRYLVKIEINISQGAGQFLTVFHTNAQKNDL